MWLFRQRKKGYDSIDPSISAEIEENLSAIKEALSHTDDLQTRILTVNQRKIGLIFLSSIIKKEDIDSKIIEPITAKGEINITSLPVSEIQESMDLQDIITGMLNGKVGIFIQGETKGYSIEASHFEKRQIKEPKTEQVIRDSHEGFSENLDTNINLIRKRLKSKNLVIKYLVLGSDHYTKVAIVYMKNRAKPDIIQKVEQRLKQIKGNFNISSGTIQNYIEEHAYSPFPQLLNTEKPERVSEYLIGGSVAVIPEGSSTALLMPVTFFAFYQATDDIQNRVYVGSFQRLIRILGFLITITLPAGYIALVSFHFEVIPIELVANVKGALENVPFPPLIEAIIMQITLELLRESAIRLPNPISQTISVVGGLVIGTAVVEANLVSNTMVIVIALTAISSFAVPVHEMGVSIRLLSFPLMILASILGFVGIIFGLILITFHLCRLETLGSPYFTPVAPLKFRQLAKSILKLPVKRSTNE